MDMRRCYFCRRLFKPSRVDQFLCTHKASTSCYDRLLKLTQAAQNFKIQYGAQVGGCCVGCTRSDVELSLMIQPGATLIWEDRFEPPWAEIQIPLDWLHAMCKFCKQGFQLYVATNPEIIDWPRGLLVPQLLPA